MDSRWFLLRKGMIRRDVALKVPMGPSYAALYGGKGMDRAALIVYYRPLIGHLAATEGFDDSLREKAVERELLEGKRRRLMATHHLGHH